MPKITVLTITARDLYLADQTQSLNQQTLQEFEWVIVDAKRDKNREVEKIARFPVQYLCDKERKDYFAGGQAYNWGIVHARGELIYFMSDYVIPSPNSLERHWRIYEKYQKVFISGRTARFDCTPATFVSISGMVGARDYRSGSLPDKKEIERNLFLVQNVTSPAWWSGRNDSAPLEALLECNGFEEDLDGRWGGHDGELANRMVTAGYFFLYYTESMALEFEHKTGQGKSIRNHKQQLELAERLVREKIAEKNYRSNLKRDLREERGRWLNSVLLS